MSNTQEVRPETGTSTKTEKTNGFLNEALKYAKMGLYVFPLIARMQEPLTKHGVKDATNDPTVIQQWWTMYPDANVGLAARASKIGDPCFLEFDQKPTLKDWAKNENQPMPQTRVHKSGGKGAPHYIFQHTEKSLALGNCDGSIGKKEWYSFRAHNRYVVAPPSIHPISQQPYEVWRNGMPAPIPDWVVERIRLNGMPEREFAKDLPTVDDDFDFDEFCEWAQVEIGDEDGGWHGLKECPFVGRRHQNQGVRGCALYYDGAVLGFKCMAAECPSNMERNGHQSGIAYFVSKLSEKRGNYEGVIWTEQDALEQALEFGAEILEGDLPKPTNGAVTPEQQLLIEKTAFGMGIKPTAEEEESELRYLQLRFPYEALPEGRLKNLTDKACEGGIDAGWVVPALLTLISSLPAQDKMCGQRINMYTTLLAMVGAGKDVTIDRCIDTLGLRDSEDRTWSNYAPSGERSISQHLGDRAGTKENPARIPGPKRRCIVTYELEETLDKSKGETSSVLRAMQHYHDHNRKVYEDSKWRTTQTVDCRVSWLSGLPVGDCEIDESAFRLAFGERSSHGTGSRMVFGFGEKRIDLRSTCEWEPDKSLYEFGKTHVEQMDFGPVVIDNRETLEFTLYKAEVKGWAPGVKEQYLAWSPEKDLSGRDLHLGGKIAVLTALANGHELIEQADWDFAKAFMRWQHEIRLVFASGKAKTVTMGEFKEIILKEAEKRTKKVKQNPKNTKDAGIGITDGEEHLYIRWKAMSRDGKWFRFGWDISKVIEGLVNDGFLMYKQEYVPSEDKDNEGRWEQDKAWVEWVE